MRFKLKIYMKKNQLQKKSYRDMKLYYKMQQNHWNLKDNKKLNQSNKENKCYKKQEFKWQEEAKQLGIINMIFIINYRVDKNTPYLINISDDPSMSGCLVFYLKNGDNSFGMNK